MQLKRNKEMEFETLKKSHKKRIIIGALAICLIGGALTFTTSRARYKLTEDLEIAKGTINYKPYDFKIMAMYQSEDGANYTEIADRMPKDYIINEEKSYCTIDNVNHDNEVKLYTKNGEHLFKNLKKSDKCYIYFDKYRNEQTALGTLKVNYSKPDFSQIATTDEGIFGVEDEMYGGTSYYWRGAATTNYLRFGGYCWRIIRINGDGTIRLIYDGTTCHQNGEITTDSIAVQNVQYNASYDQSNYVGWTYEGVLQRPTNNLTATSSNAKTQLENWYSANITGTDAMKVASGKYCNDRNVQSGSTWSATGQGFAYAGNKRIYVDYAPTLSCNSSDEYILNVGLITADEVMYAGGRGINNTSYYLYNGQNYWTMSPDRWYNEYSYTWVFYVDTNGFLNNELPVSNIWGLRPVISLRSNITISNGDGTLNNPYVVQ